MVFVHNGADSGPWFGGVLIRGTVKYLSMLIGEVLVGVLVACVNLLLVLVMIYGWNKLIKNKFYIILANLLVCTSLKAFVELAFISPYYIMQNEKYYKSEGYFTEQYQRIFFNMSVLADYGVLFFSLLIAIHRILAVRRSFFAYQSRVQIGGGFYTSISCGIVWTCTAVVPGLFYVFECQYKYESERGLYSMVCLATNGMDALNRRTDQEKILLILLKCLIYLSYACTVAVLVLYVLILEMLRRQRRAMVQNATRSRMSGTQLQILWQSLVVFVLYAGSILCIFVLSFANLKDPEITTFDIAYVENLLNLSIAAAYPICFLAMSGEMRSILVRRLRWSSGASTVHVSSNDQPGGN